MLEALLVSLNLIGGFCGNSLQMQSMPFTNEEVEIFTQDALHEEDGISFTSDSEEYYGNAGVYVQNTLSTVNCFGYAIDVNSWISISFFQACTLIDDSMYFNRVIPAVIQEAGSYGVSLRTLNGLMDTINSNERRIAFRVARTDSFSFIDFHFMKQHSDGSWSHKLGSFNSFQFNTSYTNTPEYDSAWYFSNDTSYVYYNTPTVYFAVIS